MTDCGFEWLNVTAYLSIIMIDHDIGGQTKPMLLEVLLLNQCWLFNIVYARRKLLSLGARGAARPSRASAPGPLLSPSGLL